MNSHRTPSVGDIAKFATLLVASIVFGGCANVSTQSSTTITALLPHGMETDRASTLLVDSGININTFDGRFFGWTTVAKNSVNLNPNSGRQARSLLLAPGAHSLSLSPAHDKNSSATSSGEWVLSHRFETGRAYRITVSSSEAKPSARFEAKDANGSWTLVKPLPLDANMTVGRAAVRKIITNAGIKLDH